MYVYLLMNEDFIIIIIIIIIIKHCELSHFYVNWLFRFVWEW